MPLTDSWPYGNYNQFDDCNFKEESAVVLQKQLGDMEGEVKEIQMELAAIRNERLDVSNRRNRNVVYGLVPEPEEAVRDNCSANPVSKYPEILKMREDLVRAKNAADEEKAQREKYQEKLKDLERKLNDICSAELEEKGRSHTAQEVAAMKSQIRDMKEEIEELRFTVNEKTEQLQEYRMRYLQAQQQVEEAKRQRDMIEFDNKQVTDQIHVEIQKMKLQFQEKLQELAQLPDLLKGAQIQLQESKQLQQLAEESTQQISNELHFVREKLLNAVNSLNQEKAEKGKLLEEIKIVKITLLEKDHAIDEISKELDDFKAKAFRLEEKLAQQEIRYKEKAAECASILKDLEELRTESSRSITRVKERSETSKRYMQAQISELEKQLVQSRAQCRASQKERDDIRGRMQMQISSLQENFELVEIRLRGLHNQVDSLKSSYSYILTNDNEDLATSLVES